MEKQSVNITLIMTTTLAAVVLTSLVLAQLSSYQRIPNTGNVKATIGIGVYSDSQCTSPLTSINWGDVQAGQSYSRTIYLKNNGNVKVRLSMTVENWTPSSASSYLTLSWNRQDNTLNPGESFAASLNLAVASTAVGGSFSFDIVITATESQ